jgi:CO dehydrogenase maturation factor
VNVLIKKQVFDLQTGIKIAICGKGGVGKTTVCAIWAHLFAEDGFDVIAVDADPDPNLSSSFGVPYDQRPVPLIQMKQLLEERTETKKDIPGIYFKLNPKVSDLPEKYCLKLNEILPQLRSENRGNTLRLLVLGGITQFGSGCACPEGVFLKALLTHAILHRKELILVDLAAGVEFMGRASVQGIDGLVIVVEPGSRSIETARHIRLMAQQLGVKYIAGIINKVSNPEDITAVTTQLEGLIILETIDYCSEIQHADLCRQSAYQSNSKIVNKLRDAKNVLTHMIGINADSRCIVHD